MNNSTEHGPPHPEEQGRSSKGTEGTLGTLEEKARDMAAGAANVAGQVKDKAKEWGQAAAQGAERAWDATRDKASAWGHAVAETASDAWEGAGSFIRRYPVASLGIAVGVGFILGGALAATSRRHRP